jgi:hypothetical protein
LQDTSQLQAQVAVLTGTFRVRSETGVPGLTLVAPGKNGRTEVRFQGVMQQAMPERIENPRIVRVSAIAGTRPRCLFEVQSTEGSWRFEADSVQVHEHPVLFGRAVALPPFRFSQRVLWKSLLWMARFPLGRALIGRLTSRKR